MREQAALEKVVSRVVTGLGFTCVGLQYLPQGKYATLRVYVDKPGGITLDDCTQVSRHLNTVLSVEGPLKGEYTLEVSSPGLDRLLFSVAQCEEQIGKRVSIRLMVPMEGKRNFKGTLERIEGERLCIVDENGEEVMIVFGDIETVRLVPEW